MKNMGGKTMKITLKDGSVKEYAEAKRAREIEEIREKKALADRLRGEIGSSEKSLNDFLLLRLFLFLLHSSILPVVYLL